ncbi:hypothetical protein [Lactococcus lactis]|uniref:hypothetical protein n=1 Tax=Lactococcus lactis TaxID=1358 RepID=UPI000724B5A6|nr:hypothetical protein [Lactococcus lactis]KST94192.1 hypothetical protein KF146_2208 [Lactococcus lactis subsp. lactis]MDU0396615.1 hypothetical protein [Lactococcus lactis]
MNQFIQFVSALAVSILTESFKAWLSDKRSSKKHKKRHQAFIPGTAIPGIFL